ncbi:DUF1080 domain-containing protein [Caminibacter mediatlanticus TB-2]|uniref:DUF1080 domain-containing protein n=1 Tax=Caminibacter mediatlanticus TB-2 TaxID=391592 RepID=A0ABX5V995_9BACT|nr:CsgG/HfaB family protein [Caminibacter mediatlanticus]QCT94865.1 DUF1080 domain-containing protein [Caminibacter mediatlanticus TB-2]
MLLNFFSGCGTSISNVSTSKQNINDVASYHGKKARIAVASFKCKAAKCNGPIGSGISDMLTTALMKTNKFIILERDSEAMRAIQNELNNQIIMTNRHANRMEGADILVVGAITAFEPKAGGFGIGGVAIPLNVPVIGGIKFAKNDAYIALDLRLVDISTGRVLAATTIEGKASSWKVGIGGGGYSSGIILGGGLSKYKNTPMEKAVRVLINKAVAEIEKLVPNEYYRYPANYQNNTTNNQSVNQISTTNINTNKPKINAKLIYSEDFEKYGIGQHTPFGAITGNGFIQLGVDKNNQTSKVLVIDNNFVCINKKFKDFILTFDAKPNQFGTMNIYFRYSRDSKIGYKLNDYDHWNFKLIKTTPTSESIYAQAQVNNLNKPNKWYFIKIIANNDNIKISYDNRLILDVKDKDHYFNKSGQICIQLPNNKAIIDNIKIYKINN